MRKLQKIAIAAMTAVSIMLVPVFSAFAASAVVSTDVLNVRTGPSTGYEVATQLGRGTNVEILESANGWSKINYGTGVNYVDSNYVSLLDTSSNPVVYSNFLYGKVVNASSLNIRAAANTNSAVVGKAALGAAIAIIGKHNGFVMVNHNGQYAYMSEAYISYITRAEYDAYYAAPVAAQTQQSVSSKGSQIVSTAMQYIGVPYVYGGTTPSGFDCSGFTSYVYGKFGYSLNRTAAGQASNGSVVASKADLQPGDLLLFKSSDSSGIGHVGIYVGDGNMIHAPKPGSSIKITSINSSYYTSRYVGARRFA